MSTDAVDFAVVDDVPPVPDHLRILDAREEYHRAVITCCRSFGRRRYARAVRRKVCYLEILQEELPPKQSRVVWCVHGGSTTGPPCRLADISTDGHSRERAHQWSGNVAFSSNENAYKMESFQHEIIR